MKMETLHPSISRRDLMIGAAAAVAPVATRAQSRSGTAPVGDAVAGAGRRRSAGRFDVDGFVEACTLAAAETDPQGAVRDVLDRAISDPRAVLLGVGEPQKGGIETLHRSAGLTVLNIVWAPLMQLMPHEHNMWSVIGIYTGREDNIFWERRPGTVAAVGAEAISAGRAVPLSKSVIHSVANPIEKLTGALHIYGGDFFAVERSEWDPETLLEREWDVEGALRIFRQSNERFSAWEDARTCG